MGTVQTACVLVFVASSIEIAHSNKTELSFFRETNQDKDLQKSYSAITKWTQMMKKLCK